MTVQAWIDALSKFDRGTDVIVRMANEDSGDEMMATKPVFAMDIGCDDSEYLGIQLMDEDEGIEEVEAAVDDLPEMPARNSSPTEPGNTTLEADNRRLREALDRVWMEWPNIRQLIEGFMGSVPPGEWSEWDEQVRRTTVELSFVLAALQPPAPQPSGNTGLCPVCGGKTTTLMPCPACTPQRNADAHTGYPMRDSEW